MIFAVRQYPCEMQFFSKDTPFNELPTIVKQKIINIRNLSMQHKECAQQQPIDSSALEFFEHVSVPSSRDYCEVFTKMVKLAEKLENFDATESLKEDLAEFSEFIRNYRMEVNNTDFVGELEKTIGLLEDRFEKLMKRI